MTFADDLRKIPDARRERAAHPKGFEPGVKFDPSMRPTEITLPEIAKGDTHADWQASIEAFTGQPLPPGAHLRLVEAKFDPAAWTRSTEGEDALTRPVWRPKFAVDYDTTTDHEPIDAVAILKSLRKRTRPTPTYDGGITAGLSWNDWQVGKRAGGGTPAFLERIDSAFTAADERHRELTRIGRDLGHLVIAGVGDIIEGCTIFANQPYEIDCEPEQQRDTAETTVLDGLDRLAPRFKRVTVLVVGGNHGENRQNGKATSRRDNTDTGLFRSVARAAARDPRLQHVEFVIADGEPAKTLDIHGWILAITHGHKFDGGPTPEKKAYNWYCKQAAGHLPAGDANVLLTGHYHSEMSADWGACLWKQAGHMDGGSDHFTDTQGKWSDPGMLSWVMTPDHRWMDEQVLR